MIFAHQVEESIEYFLTTRKVEKCDLTLKHLENLELVSDNGGWEMEKLVTLFKVCLKQCCHHCATNDDLTTGKINSQF